MGRDKAKNIRANIDFDISEFCEHFTKEAMKQLHMHVADAKVVVLTCDETLYQYKKAKGKGSKSAPIRYIPGKPAGNGLLCYALTVHICTKPERPDKARFMSYTVAISPVIKTARFNPKLVEGDAAPKITTPINHMFHLLGQLFDAGAITEQNKHKFIVVADSAFCSSHSLTEMGVIGLKFVFSCKKSVSSWIWKAMPDVPVGMCIGIRDGGLYHSMARVSESRLWRLITNLDNGQLETLLQYQGSVLGDVLGADNIDGSLDSSISLDSLASEAYRRFGDETDLETILRNMEIILNEPDMNEEETAEALFELQPDILDQTPLMPENRERLIDSFKAFPAKVLQQVCDLGKFKKGKFSENHFDFGLTPKGKSKNDLATIIVDKMSMDVRSPFSESVYVVTEPFDYKLSIHTFYANHFNGVDQVDVYLGELRSNIACHNWKYKLFQLFVGYVFANYITLYNLEKYATGIDVATVFVKKVVDGIAKKAVSCRGRKRKNGPDIDPHEMDYVRRPRWVISDPTDILTQ